MESAERASHVVRTSSDEGKSPAQEPLCKMRNEAQVDNTRDGSGGQKGALKAVRFSEDSSSGDGHSFLQKGGEFKHALDHPEAPFQKKAGTDTVSSDEPTQQTRGRSQRSGKQRSKRSQTPFQHRKVDVYGSDENDDDIDNVDSRSDEVLSSACDPTSQATEASCSLFSEPNANDMKGSKSMVPSCQIKDSASEESKSAPKCDEDRPVQVNSPNSGIRPCVTVDVSTNSEKDRILSFEPACVSKSPVSTSVRFMEVPRDAHEEQVANLATAGTRPGSINRDLDDSVAGMSPRGRRRMKTGKRGRRSQTPFNPRNISYYDSEDDETEGVGPSHADVQMPVPTTGSNDVSEAETTTQAGGLDERVSSSLRPLVPFTSDAQPGGEISAELHSNMPLTSASVRFSEPIDGSAQQDSNPAQLREAFMETDVVAPEGSSSSISPRGRQREPTWRPSRRSQTPFNRRSISYSDDEYEVGKSTTSVNQSSCDSGFLDPSDHDVTKSREKPDMKVSSKPRVTFAAEVRSSDETMTSPAASSVRFVDPGIVLSDKQAGVVNFHENVEEKRESHSETPSAKEVLRGRQRRANRKPGKRSQTPFSRRPININTSDDEDIAETNINQATIYTPRPSVFNTNSDPDRVSVDDENRQQIPAETKPFSTTVKVPELIGMQGSARVSPTWSSNMDRKGNQIPSHQRKGHTFSSDDENGDTSQFSKDSDIDMVCRSISRVTACSLASEEIHIFQKGTQITSTYDVATQTTSAEVRDYLDDSQATTVGITNGRTSNIVIGIAKWFVGMLGNCH